MLLRAPNRLFPCLGAILTITCVTKAQVSDPLPPVEWSDIAIHITELSQVPASSANRPRARVAHLKPAGDGSGRLFVNDLNGRMYLVSSGAASLYLDLEVQIAGAFKDAPGLGTGFASFAFHPQFASNGKLYTAHSEDPGSGTPDFTLPNTADSVALQGVITEWTATNPAANVFAGTRRGVLRVDISGVIHGMQEISFNPNAISGGSDFGMLYICIGDGGSTIGGYPENTSRLDSHQGTIMRIDPTGTNSAGGRYGIPGDNPWASDNLASTYGEIWAYGFRNPHRISWDTGGDGKMLCGDIGERNIEEVNLIEPGRHYGWNEREGTFRINPGFAHNPGDGTNADIFPLPPDDATRGFTYPVAQYDHNEGAAIVGGYVYRGTSAPHLVGKYLFGEITDGNLYVVDADSLVLGSQSGIKRLRIKLNGNSTTMLSIVGDSRTDIRFGHDESKELYITEKRHGRIYKVIGSEGPDIPPPPTGAVRLVNLSTRGIVGTDGEIQIGGFVIGGDRPMQVLVRAAGPGLGALGVPNSVADPVLRVLTAPAGQLVGENSDWGAATNAAEIAAAAEAVGAFAFDSGSRDAALLLTLEPGGYTAQVSGSGGTTGVALVEVYSVPEE